MPLNHKVAIVTGASSGIGLAVARMLIARGARVALVARTVAKLEEAQRELGENALIYPLDVTDRDQLIALPGRVVHEFGRLDIVVNNAGVNHRGLVAERSSEELLQIIETNLVAPILLTQAALPLIGKEGVVVNVASLAGKIPLPHEATYSASKFGLRAFGSALDQELAQHDGGPKIATVNPGPVDTGFFGEDLSKVPDIVFSQPMSTAVQVAEAVLAVILGPERELDVPGLSGKLATAGYLSRSLYQALRPALERKGKKNKAKHLARTR